MTHTTRTSPESRSRSTKVESSHRHYVVNRGLLLSTLATLALLAPAAYFWYSHQLSQTADALLVRAEQLENEQEWSKATSYYQRYLLVRPDDTETLVRMVEAYAQGEPTPRRIARLTQLLYRALGHAPERSDLRLMLAENLLKMGDHAEAEIEALKLVSAAVDEGPAAQKVIALSKFARSSTTDFESLSTSIERLVAAAEHLPGDVQLVVVTAEALRKHPTAAKLAGKNPATYADEMIDRLVASDPKNVDALITRHQYRVRHTLADAESDLLSALEIAPDHVEALLLSAQAALNRDDPDEQAEALLHRAIEVAPDDPRAYLALAKLSGRASRNDQAVEWLRQGLNRTDNHLEIGLALSGELITARKLEEAARTLRDVESKWAGLMVRMNATARTQLENRLRILRARLELAHSRPTKAVVELQAILLTTEASQLAKQSAEWAQATMMLAQIAAKHGQWDQAAIYWDRLSVAFPRSANVCESAAAAYLNIGDAASAVKRIEKYSQLSDPTADMRVKLTQAHLVLQRSRPIADRNWTAFLEALARAKPEGSDRWELVLAEVDYLLADLSEEQINTDSAASDDPELQQRRRAMEILQAGENVFDKQSAFWQGAVRVYQRLGRETEVQRTLARYLEIEESSVNRAKLQVSLLAYSQKFEEADKLLEEMRASLSDIEKRGIDRLRVEILIASKQLSAAKQLAGELIATDPSDTRMLSLGIELALSLGDAQAAEKWETALGTHESSQFEWRYLRSLRQLAAYDKLDSTEQAELADSTSILRSQRPRWYPAIVLAAKHAQLNGDSQQALADYRLAVELGDRRPQTLEQLVSLLYHDDRLSEAERYLDLLDVEQGASPLRDSLAIQLAVKQNRLTEALDLAQQGVQRHPDEAMRYIWLANLLLQDKQPQEATQILRQAVQRFPKDSQVWKGLFTLFANTGRTEEARKTLAALVASDSLPEGSRHFVAAQGFEILGDLAEAKEHYELALAKDPQEIGIRLRFAKLLLIADTVSAREQYEQILRLEPDSSEARRELASLLAATGRDEDWNRAQKLLEQQTDDSPADSTTNDRIQATLLSRRGRTREQRLSNCQAARKILQRLIRTSDAQGGDINRRLLTSVYEQEATLSGDKSLLFAAREQLRNLVNRENASPQNLALYIEFLIRHATSDSTPKSTSKSTSVSTTAAAAGPGTESDVESAAANDELREVFLADAESRLRDLKKAQSAGDKGASNTFSSVNLTVRLLQARGRDDEAAAYVAQWVSSYDQADQDESTKAPLYLMTGKLYSTLGQHAEAEQWYRRLMKIAPRAYVMVVQSLLDQGKSQAAADFCLEAADGDPGPEEAILLARIVMASTQSTEPLTEVRLALEKVVAKHSDNIGLLQAEAVMQASLGEYDPAIASFRRMIKVDPNNALAMNNLATLLAEHVNQRAEAMDYIERAISIEGRLPALLDTQGTIFLKMGDDAQAIICLEEATAGGATDARYHFHLAAAYELAERIEEAGAALQTARDYGLEKTVMTDDDRSLLVRLDKQLAEKSHTTTRAE